MPSTQTKNLVWVENNEMVQECIETHRKQTAAGIIKRRGHREYVWHNQIHKTCTEKAKLSVCVRDKYKDTLYKH